MFFTFANWVKPALESTCSMVIFGSRDRKSTRLNSSHQIISYAVFCFRKKQTRCKSLVEVVATVTHAGIIDTLDRRFKAYLSAQTRSTPLRVVILYNHCTEFSTMTPYI